jgi:hypothetical protein
MGTRPQPPQTRTGSGTADVMSVAFVAAEATGDKVALKVYQRMQDGSQFG